MKTTMTDKAIWRAYEDGYNGEPSKNKAGEDHYGWKARHNMAGLRALAKAAFEAGRVDGQKEVERLTGERDDARNALETTGEEGREVVDELKVEVAAYDACSCDEHCAFERVKGRRADAARKVDEVRGLMAGVKS